MSLTKLIASVTAQRITKAAQSNAYDRIVKALDSVPTLDLAQDLPAIHPSSVIWSLVEQDPALWN